MLVDANNNLLRVGDNVTYCPTGCKGKIVMKDDNKSMIYVVFDEETDFIGGWFDASETALILN